MKDIITKFIVIVIVYVGINFGADLYWTSERIAERERQHMELQIESEKIDKEVEAMCDMTREMTDKEYYDYCGMVLDEKAYMLEEYMLNNKK